MRKRICKSCYAISAFILALPFMAPGVSAASADAIRNVMTGDQTNMGMIIGLSIAGGVAGLIIIIAIIIAIVSKKRKSKNYQAKH